MLAVGLACLMGAGAAADGTGAAALGPLIEKALHSTGSEQAEAIEEIGRLGPDAQPATSLLLSFLSSRDPNLRISSAAALGNVGPIASSAVPRLIKALDDPVIRVRAYAALALSQMASVAQRAAPALIVVMRDVLPTDVETRALHNNAVYALRLIRPSRKNVPALCEALRDPHAQVRFSAAVVLRAMGSDASGARPDLQRTLADPNPMVQEAAQAALGAVGGP